MPSLDQDTKIFPIDDFSKGIQRKSTRFQQAPSEVNAAENISFDAIGGFGKRLGYLQQGNDLVTTTTTSTSSSTTTTSTSTSTSSSSSTSTTITG